MIIDKPIQVTQLYGTDKEPNPSGGRVYSTLGTMRTLGVGNGMSQPFISEVDERLESLRIRKLTPKECWRLMGFKDEEFERAKSAGISNTQLYRQAGNSIVVDTLVNGVFKYLFTDGELWKQEQKHILVDEDFESQYRGIKIKETDIRKIKQIKKIPSNSLLKYVKK